MNHITYIDRYFAADLVEVKEIHKSKVYGTYTKRFPSGLDTMIKVWNPRLNKMVSIRKRTELVEVID